MGEATYRLTRQEVVEAFQAIYRVTLASWRGVLWFTASATLLTVLVSLAMLGATGGAWAMTALATGLSVLTMLIAFVVINYHVFIPSAAERLLGKRRGDDAGSTLRWSEKQVSIRGQKGEAIASWPDFKRYLETPRSLVLIPDPSETIFILPRAALGADGLAAIKGHLTRHGVRPASFRNA